MQLNKFLDSDEEKSRRKKKSREEYSEESEDDSEEDRPSGRGGRSRGRQPKERIGGCTDIEIRKFIKSFKKYPRPLER